MEEETQHVRLLHFFIMEIHLILVLMITISIILFLQVVFKVQSLFAGADLVVWFNVM